MSNTRSFISQLAALFLVPAQVALFVPVVAAAPPASGSTPGAVAVRRGPAPPLARTSPRLSGRATTEEIASSRVFEEPLVPVGGEPSAAENRALVKVIAERSGPAGFEAFLRRFPESAWRASLLGNLGDIYRRTGFFSRAQRAYQEAWDLAKDEDSAGGRAVADRAVGDLASLLARLGDVDRLREVLAATDGRPVGGVAGERLQTARQDLWLMEHEPNQRFRCGISALTSVLAELQPGFAPDPRWHTLDTGSEGLSLSAVRELASQVGFELRVARRGKGAEYPVPSVVHFKAGHFGALVGTRGGEYLLRDAALGGELWVSARALDEETSGAFLVPQDALPEGWTAISEEDAATIRGRGPTNAENGEHCKPCRDKVIGAPCPPTNGGASGLPTYRVFSMLVSVNITDSPVGYVPSRGPGVSFTASYNQREIFQFGYDKTDQLTAAILKSTDPTPTILKRQFWSYDPAGNRTAEQNDDAVTGAAYNNMNQLLSQAAGGALVFKGTVNEPANVTVGGKLANVSADNRFEGQAVVPSGTGQVQVTATDPSGNVRTNTYEVSQGATSKAFTYDPNGNMTSDGTKTYEWDAANGLVAVKQGGSTVASYTYNAAGIRTSKTVGGVTTSYMLEGANVVEERAGGVTTKDLQGPGIDNVLATQDGAGTVTYLTRDHLGSIRELATDWRTSRFVATMTPGQPDSWRGCGRLGVHWQGDGGRDGPQLLQSQILRPEDCQVSSARIQRDPRRPPHTPTSGNRPVRSMDPSVPRR